MIDRNTPEWTAIEAILVEAEMATDRPDIQELADSILTALARLSVADGPGPEERPEVEPGHNHTTTGLPTYPVCRAACPLGCDKPLPPTEQIEVRPGEFLPRPRMFVMDPIAEGEAGLAVRRAAALPVHREELGHGTPVPEEAELPSGDARIEGLGHREELSR